MYLWALGYVLTMPNAIYQMLFLVIPQPPHHIWTTNINKRVDERNWNFLCASKRHAEKMNKANIRLCVCVSYIFGIYFASVKDWGEFVKNRLNIFSRFINCMVLTDLLSVNHKSHNAGIVCNTHFAKDNYQPRSNANNQLTKFMSGHLLGLFCRMKAGRFFFSTIGRRNQQRRMYSKLPWPSIEHDRYSTRDERGSRTAGK